MSRSQDTVIDDDEETCPLCIEEFDLSDKNFRPCPCGYQICQFCFNSLKTTYEKSTCPNCRRVYDEKTIQYKIPTAEEFKLDLQAKNRKQAAAKRKETEKREVETSSRRNLAGVRVKQQNLVYVIGLIPDLKDEPKLLQMLRGKDFFGQYGEIEKVVVSKAKPGATSQGVGVYVTFARKEDAALCISAVDGSINEDRVLRAQYGTTKYCSAYLRGEVCNNKNCSFLHETGEDGQDTTLQNEPIKVTAKSTTTAPQLASRASQPINQTTISSQPMARQTSSDNTENGKGSSIDASALPSSASWGNAIPPLTKSRRASQVASRPSPSPQISSVVPVPLQNEEARPKEPTITIAKMAPQSHSQHSTSTSSKPATDSPGATTSRPTGKRETQRTPLDDLLATICSGNLRFIFNESVFSPDELAALERHPNLIDPHGGAKMRLQKDRKAAERVKHESELQARIQVLEQVQSDQLPIDTTVDEEKLGAGSLALGGEPEEDARSASARGTIQRPSQSDSATNFINDQFANMNVAGRSLTPHQQRQLALLTNGVQQAPGLAHPAQGVTGSDVFDFDRRGAQYQSQSHYDSLPGHQRQGSRYFNNENPKSNAPSRYQSQSSFYTSGIQGPPPGLKTAGTPPISGGGMFAHGQGFTSSVNANFGASKDPNADFLTRGRSGTNSGHDVSKRGGVVDHADPSILQSRLHQSAASGAQGLFSGQNQGVEEFPPLPVKRPEPPGPTSRIPSVQGSKEPGIRSSTPKLPPGLNISHAHPSPVASKDLFTEPTRVKSPLQTAGPVTPAVPLLAISQRPLTPKMKLKEAGADRVEPYIAVESALRSVDTDAPSKTTSDKEISLGSPRLKPAQSMREAHNDEDLGLRSPVEAKPDKRSNVPTSRVIDKLSQSKPPAKLDIEAATAGKASQGSPSDTTMAMPSEFVGTPSVISSRPTTPATMASETPSKASVQRPRTLRVVTGMNQKADTAPASAVTEKSVSILASNQPKQRSRQPSVSSMSRSRPSTPAISEAFSFDASRASSPPPGIIGSAPERLKSKAQQKKDRRDKSRRTTETVDESTNAAISTPAEEVAPVISRQRKQKKRVESSAASEAPLKSPIDVGESVKAAIPVRPKKKDSMEGVSMRGGDAESAAAKVPTQLKRTDSKKSSTPASPKEPEPESQVAQELPGPLYTLRDLYTDAARQPGTSSDFQALLNEHIAPIQKVLASLISNNDIEISNPLFNPPPLSSYRLPGDSRRGADYLDANGYTDSNPFGMVYLSQDKKRAIQNGHAVRISDANKPNDLLRRAMVSPTGTVWRHLSEAEEERVLELEERREVFADEWGSLGLGMMDKLGALEEGDYMNLEGGMEELARAGEVHGVSWILQDDEDDEDGDVEQEQSIRQPFDDELSDDGTDDLGALSVPGVWAVAQALGTVPNNAGITNQANVLPPMKTLPTTSTTLRAMDVETLYKRIAETQRDIEQARKDMDKIEKLCGRKSKEVGKFRDSVLRF